MRNKKRWMKLRHKVIMNTARPFFALTAKKKYHAKVAGFDKEGKRNYLILSNHQTDFDQFFIGLSFRQPIYYIASEDVFSNGFVSRLLEWAVAPIPFMKASFDLKAIKTCIRVAREGGSIALFPEGNRTYSGKTCYIKPGVAALAKKLGLPIAIYRFEGGYGIKPRWADKAGKGEMSAGVRKVIEPEEYEKLSAEELHALICSELDIDDFERGGECFSKRSAEGIERMIYVCPDCGISEFGSEKDTFFCKKCGKKYRYLPNRHIEALEGETKLGSIGAWYDYQEEYIRSSDLSGYTDVPIFTDRADIFEVILFKKKKRLEKNIELKVFSDGIVTSGKAAEGKLSFADISAMTCLGKHKLNILYKDKVYQFKGGKSFNALKYCNIYYHIKFMGEEHKDGEFQFLGL